MSQRVLLFVLAGIVWVFPVMGQHNQDKVKRLDGSAITAAEIDTTVTRVMKAAEVPGSRRTAPSSVPFFISSRPESSPRCLRRRLPALLPCSAWACTP